VVRVQRQSRSSAVWTHDRKPPKPHDARSIVVVTALPGHARLHPHSRCQVTHDIHTPSMNMAVSASRNKPFKNNGHNDAISPLDRIHPSDSPKLSPQISFRCLDDAQPHSSTEDDYSDTSADESERQGHVGNATAPSQEERMADEFKADIGSEFSKGQPRSPSSLADLDLSIIIAVIAPLVNWLTGSDQLKNLFLILFLIVYLHQLVQGVLQRSCSFQPD